MSNISNIQNLPEFKNLSIEEQEVALQIMDEYINKGESKKLNNLIYDDYEEIPVTIEEFVDNDYYLGQAWKDNEGKTKLYPYWRKRLNELFPDNITTNVNNAIFSGARGLGKSEIAVLVAAYLMYRDMCLKNPIEHYHLKPTEKLCYAFMNIKLALAEEIGNSKFQNTVKMSPWFLNHGTLEGRSNKIWVPPSFINIIIGSQASDVIGLPVKFAFFDEISFIQNQDIDKQKQKAKDMIDTAIGGMKTRFLFKGKLQSLLVLASSKRSEKSFLEEHMKKKLQSEGENVLIVDEPVWNIKPPETYSGIKFNVALGNKFLPSRVIEDNSQVEDYIRKGYTIIPTPIEFLSNFKEDIDRALCDYAGISSSELSKYISGKAVEAIIKKELINPFTKDIIEVGNDAEDKSQYYDYFDLNRVPSSMMSKPLFIHLDMSVSGDMTGIAGIWIKGKKVSNDKLSQANDLSFQLAFSVSIKAPKGRQISFEKNRQFIYWLKEQGFKIKGITTDTFQSYDTGQALKAKGYNYEILSVDRVDPSSHICIPYQYFKSTIDEGRLEMYDSITLIEEIVNLERNINTGKVDHPENFRKDVSDALCLGSGTQIYLLDGSHKTIKELYEEKGNGVDNWVLAYNTLTANLEPVKIFDVVNNGYREELLKLYLDNGKEVICTPDHKLLTRSGSYVEAQDSLGVSLMPFNYESKVMFKDRDYPYVYIPQGDGSNKGMYLHKLVCENLHATERADKEQKRGEHEFIVIHHKDCNRFNNNPENLEYLTNKEHSLKHVSLNTSDKKKAQLSLANKKAVEKGLHPFQLMSQAQHAENGRSTLIKLNKSDKHRKAVSESNKRLASKGMLSLQIKGENAHTPEANLKRRRTCMSRYGEVGFKSDIIQGKCRESCLKRNGYDNPFHSKTKQEEMRINKLKKAYSRILSEFNLTEDDYMSLFDFKLYCYILRLSGVSSKVSDIVKSGLNIDVNNYNEKEYKSLQNKGNCVRLFLRDTSKETLTYGEFLEYYNERVSQYNKNKGGSSFKSRFRTVPSYDDIVKLGFNIYNHRVVRIEKIAGDYVYDLKLDRIHNFAITAGIFVHNCGAIFNASKHAEEFAYDYGEDLSITTTINNSTSFENNKQQINLLFEQEMQKAFDPRIRNQQPQDQTKKENDDPPQQTQFMDFGLGAAKPLSGAQYLKDGIIIW